MKILVFAGSTRHLSYNRRLAQQAAGLVRAAGARPTLLELSEFEVPMYNADLEEGGTPADVMRLKQLFWEHPAWLICSPEYNGGITALLKNTLDWVSSPVRDDPDWSQGSKPFTGKVVGLLSASPGGFGGVRSLSQLVPMLLNLQCWVCPKQAALPHADQAFDEAGTLRDAQQLARVNGVVQQLLWAAQRLHADRPAC